MRTTLPFARSGLGERAYCSSLWILVLLAANAAAAVIHVPADYPTIQAAIDAASNDDEIIVAPGTYPEAVDLSGKAIHLRSSDGAAVTTIDATGMSTSVVTCISGEGPDTILEGFTITGGEGTLQDAHLWGGGMYIRGSSPTVAECVFVENRAEYGGGINADWTDLTLTQCTFSENTADFYGGGVAIWADVSHPSAPTMTGCTFTGNTAGAGGGGLSSYGGYVFPSVTNCTFTGNDAGEQGGGMFDEYSSSTVVNCTFRENNAVERGGGLESAGGNSVVINCTFAENTAGTGGGMWTCCNSMSIVNCLFVANDSSIGGGMSIEYGGPLVTNCTLTQNQADLGGAIYVLSSAPEVTNSILWANSEGEIYEPNDPNYQSTVWVIHSDVQGGASGVGNIDDDPQFADPLNGDFRLTPTSPCVDAGANRMVRASSDVDGFCRVMDGNGDGAAVVDMGPYEMPGAVLDCNDDGVCDTQQPAGPDCNHNLIPDECDLASGTSHDCNLSGTPDECESDCNKNGLADECDIAEGASQDCNANGTPDECDIANGVSQDCNFTGVPDECENDCNGNGLADECDIASGGSQDCNSNGIPDECDIANGVSQDCNSNGVPDECDIASGVSQDCNSNGVPDDCDIATGVSPDCNANGTPDECDIASGGSQDCDSNGVPDECDPDCNTNGVADACDILAGTSLDVVPPGGNGVPDECETATVIAGPYIHGHHLYYLLSQANWTISEAAAVLLGGHLVTINDAAENQFVFETFSSLGGVSRGLWIGLNDAAVEGVFVWVSGEPVTYVAWGPGEPNNCYWCCDGGNENYVHIFWPDDPRAGSWNDMADKRAWCGGDLPLFGVIEVVGAPCIGDLDGDFVVSAQDLALLLSHYGIPSGAEASDGDFDGDGDVDADDLAQLLSRFDTICEP